MLAKSAIRSAMHTLILYDSAFGNTAQIAKILAKSFEALGPTRLACLYDEPYPQLADVDLLVIGSPTQHHGSTPLLEAWLQHLDINRVKGMAVIAFDTRFRMSEWLTGSAARRVSQVLLRHGAHIVLPPESFFVDERSGPLAEGELERAENWAAQIGVHLPEYSLAV
jgi:flavodoxin